MNYQETLEFLFSQLPMYQRQGSAAYKADLKTTLALDEHFHHPHQSFQTIHIAGTNGKGSVSHMLSSALQEARYKTGLYTSPHLRDFRERIRVNGKMISEDFVVRFVEYNVQIIKELMPSFFEITAAMAFEYFYREHVDVAIIETGMGGRLDSTNIIKPIVSVITNIGFDHTQFLGNTLSAIATEKAGIMKPKTPVVIGEKQPKAMVVYRNKSNELAAPVFVAQDRFEVMSSQTKTPFSTQNIRVVDKLTCAETNWELDLSGSYQVKNLVTVLGTLEVIRNKFPVSEVQLQSALRNVRKNTGFAGRWQILNNKPLTIADIGHNKEGLMIVLSQIAEIEYEKLHIVLGVVDDKNIADILPMFPTDARYYFCKAAIPRALDANTLCEQALSQGLMGEVYFSVHDAYVAATEQASDNDLVYIGGSTFVVAEVV